MTTFKTVKQCVAETKDIVTLPDQLPEQITTRQAAAYAGVSLSTFRKWEAQGITPPRTQGCPRLYRKCEVLNFLVQMRADDYFRDQLGIRLPKTRVKMTFPLSVH